MTEKLVNDWALLCTFQTVLDINENGNIISCEQQALAMVLMKAADDPLMIAQFEDRIVLRAVLVDLEIAPAPDSKMD